MNYTSTWKPRRLFIQKEIIDDPLVRDVIERFTDLDVEIVDSHHKVYSHLERHPNPLSVGKQWLYLARNNGKFLKPCPGLDPDLACCNLWVLNTAIGCSLDCTYCFLQTYLPQQVSTCFVNIDEIAREIDDLLAAQENAFVRVCTGELSDSLALDHITGLSRKLIQIFAARERTSLELKTKTANIGGLKGLDHKGRVVISWSMNAEPVADREEHLTSTINERLAAATQVERWGYRVGFHFDPMIHYDGWEADYERTVERIFENVSPNMIAWISLGTVRYDRGLKPVVQDRFPTSRFVYGEFIPGPDGKMRYPEPLRVEMFSSMHDFIRARSKSVPVYLCMESYNVWEKAFGGAPSCRRDVAMKLQSTLNTELIPMDAERSS